LDNKVFDFHWCTVQTWSKWVFQREVLYVISWHW